MSSERFLLYRLSKTSLEKTVPLLISKIYHQKKMLLLLCPDAKEVDALDKILWTYTPLSFLPHGCETKDKTPSEHPIWISTSVVEREVCIAVKGAIVKKKIGTELLILFSAHIAEECLWAKNIYDGLRIEHAPIFWEQTESGWNISEPNFSVII